MSFTSLSAALLLVVAVSVFWGVRRGMRRGLTPTALTLSAVAVSALVAAPLAVWLSDYSAKAMATYTPYRILYDFQVSVIESYL